MGGFFGVATKEDCVTDLFYGTDYHSHLGTVRGGMVVRNSHGSAVLFSGSVAGSVAETRLDTVLPGQLHTYVGIELTATHEGISDGLVATVGALVDVADTTIVGVSRAGLLFSASFGSILRTGASSGRFGLLLQDGSAPDFSDPGNTLEGSEHDVLTDGALPVPEAPPLPSDG